jgi:sugar O-acyltransferase (sialic acid O-acetyltransferase NeuD family)
MILSEILVPLLNANEPEARLVSIHVKDGQPVSPGIVLFTIETTKASTEVEAPKAGYFRLLAKEGDLFGVGQRLAVITDTPDERVQDIPSPAGQPEPAGAGGPPADLRITKPALALAQSLGVDLSGLPRTALVTEAVIRQHARQSYEPIHLPPSEKPYIVIYGAGGHSKTIMEMILQLDTYTIAGILDDNESLTGSRVMGIPVLGSRQRLAELAGQNVRLAANGVGGILDIGIRVKIFELLEGAGFELPVLVHPRATVEPSARVETGVQVFANAYIGTEAVLHSKCMVNTNAVVSHDCEIGAYTHIAPGALLAGHVHVGSRCLIGMGVTTSIGVKVGSDVRVGNGAILLADVPDKTIIQAGRFWTGRAESQK